MTREEVLERLRAILREIFDDEELVITEETSAQDIEGWDSLEHINLINSVEREFDIRFDMGQMAAMGNVGELADIVMSKL